METRITEYCWRYKFIDTFVYVENVGRWRSVKGYGQNFAGILNIRRYRKWNIKLKGKINIKCQHLILIYLPKQITLNAHFNLVNRKIMATYSDNHRKGKRYSGSCMTQL